jgi:hypothetical protein
LFQKYEKGLAGYEHMHNVFLQLACLIAIVAKNISESLPIMDILKINKACGI